MWNYDTDSATPFAWEPLWTTAPIITIHCINIRLHPCQFESLSVNHKTCFYGVLLFGLLAVRWIQHVQIKTPCAATLSFSKLPCFLWMMKGLELKRFKSSVLDLIFLQGKPPAVHCHGSQSLWQCIQVKFELVVAGLQIKCKFRKALARQIIIWCIQKDLWGVGFGHQDWNI